VKQPGKKSTRVNLEVKAFESELLHDSSKSAEVKVEIQCRKCGGILSSQQALIQHDRSHAPSVRPRMFGHERGGSEVRAAINELVDRVVALVDPAEREGELKTAVEKQSASEAQKAERSAALLAEREQRKVRALDLGRRGSTKHSSYTVADKNDYLEVYDKLLSDPSITNKAETFEAQTGIPTGTLKGWDWVRDRVTIRRAAGQARAKKLLRIDTVDRRQGKYAVQERRLNAQLHERRNRGRRCSPRWLTHTMRVLVREAFPQDDAAQAFLAGARWRRRFLARFRLTTRRKTNQKNISWEEVKPVLIRYFQRFIQRLRARDRVPGGAPYDDTYGLYMPYRRLNVDQVPLPFINGAETTYDDIGAKRVRINGLQSGLNKRQATAQLCIRGGPLPAAAGLIPVLQQPKVAIIFRGTGQRISQMEKDGYHDDVTVLWQAKAWVDRQTANAWVRDVIAPLVAADKKAGIADDDSRYLLLADNLDAQTHDTFRSELKRLQVDLHLLPPGKTDFAQPIDAGFGRVVKLYMGEEMDKWLDDDNNLERWESNALSASDRRILMTHWLGHAYKKASEDWNQVTKYWEHTGGLMTITGDFGASKLKFDGVNEKFTIPDPFYANIAAPRARADPEPEDVAPSRESANDEDEAMIILDDEDDADEEDVLAEFPSGLVQLPAPDASALEVGSNALVGMAICFNWTAVGWCVGEVVRANSDRRRKIDGGVVNYYVHYEIDDEEAEHVLELGGYGKEWVLVRESAEDAPAAAGDE